jgi:ribonuclease VapC
MVIDTSAIVAILLAEDDAPSFTKLIEDADHCVLSAVSCVEASIVLQRPNRTYALQRLDALLAAGRIAIVPFTAEQGRAAASAYLRFGKGRHPARLNFGDSMVYALAQSLRQPLLAKGADFRHTDLPCLP